MNYNAFDELEKICNLQLLIIGGRKEVGNCMIITNEDYMLNSAYTHDPGTSVPMHWDEAMVLPRFACLPHLVRWRHEPRKGVWEKVVKLCR